MQVRRDIVAQQGEEAGDGKGLVAVAQDLKVDGVQVEVKGEVGDGGVDGDHEEDSDDTNDHTIQLAVITGWGQKWGVWETKRLTGVAPMVSSNELRVAI